MAARARRREWYEGVARAALVPGGADGQRPLRVEVKELEEKRREEFKEEVNELKEQFRKDLRRQKKKIIGKLNKQVQELTEKAALECPGDTFLPLRSQTDEGKQPRFELKIESNVKEVVYKNKKIKTDKGDCIEVVMFDSGNQIAPDHPLASAKVEVVLLNGSFKSSGEKCWTKQDFESHIIGPRKGKSEIGNVNQETKAVIRNCTFELTVWGLRS